MKFNYHFSKELEQERVDYTLSKRDFYVQNDDQPHLPQTTVETEWSPEMYEKAIAAISGNIVPFSQVFQNRIGIKKSLLIYCWQN